MNDEAHIKENINNVSDAYPNALTKKELEIIPVRTVSEVMSNALTQEIQPIEWEEETLPPAEEGKDKGPGAVVTH